MKSKILSFLIPFLLICGFAYSQSSQSIWGAPHATPALTARLPVDVSSISGPGQMWIGDILGLVTGGVTINPSTGSALVTKVNNITGAANSLLGYNNAQTLANITIGSGLNLTSGVLAATGGGGGSPGGNPGDTQFNNTGSFGGYSINKTDGSGSAAGGVLYSYGDGTTRALSVGTVGGLGGVVTPTFPAANALYQITQGLMVDPRYYGAYCDAKYFDGRNGSGLLTVGSGSNVIALSGYTFSSADVGKLISMNAGSGGTGDLGVDTATIISVNTTANTAIVNVTTTAGTSSGYAILAHDDSTAFLNAAQYTAIYHGSSVMVPDGCAIRHVVFPAGTTLRGQAEANGYGYNYDVKPILYILNTGYTEDSQSTGIDITGAVNIALYGFEIKGATFPYEGFPNLNLACVGTTGGTAGISNAILLDHMAISFCPIGLGVPLQHAPTAYIFGQSRFSEFASNAEGMRGAFSDWASTSDVFTGNFTYGLHLGPQGSAPSPAVSSRFVNGRFEENGVGVYCEKCLDDYFVGQHFQFNNSYGLWLNQAKRIQITGGGFDGNGGAHVEISNSTEIHFSNNSFHNNTSYIFDATDSTLYTPAQSDYVSLSEGSAVDCCLTAVANWGTVGQPTHYMQLVQDEPWIRSSDTNFGINDGTNALNLSGQTTDIYFPKGTTGQEPTPAEGMMRYNTTTHSFEGASGSSPAWGGLGVTASGSATFTNKTYDTAGTGNVFKIAGDQITAVSGNTAKVATAAGTLTNGDCVSIDSGGNYVDAGGPCTTGGGGGTVASSTVGTIAVYSGTTTVTGSTNLVVPGTINSQVAASAAALTIGPTGNVVLTADNSQNTGQGLLVQQDQFGGVILTTSPTSGNENMEIRSSGFTSVNLQPGGNKCWSVSFSGQIQRGCNGDTIAAGAGAGTSPTISISGVALDGEITMTTGTSPTGSGAIVSTITYPGNCQNGSSVRISPANANAAALNGATSVFAKSSAANTFQIFSGTSALTAATQYIWDYSATCN